MYNNNNNNNDSITRTVLTDLSDSDLNSEISNFVIIFCLMVSFHLTQKHRILLYFLIMNLELLYMVSNERKIRTKLV